MPGDQTATASGVIRGDSYTLKSSGAETTNTTGSAIDVSTSFSLSLTVAVTAASGTSPTMTVVIEGSDDAQNWYTLGTFGANGLAPGSVATAPSNLTAATTVRGTLPCPSLVRYRSVIGGTTPSFTYSVTAIG